MPDLQKKNYENKNRKLAKLRQEFPKCVNKWVNEESIKEDLEQSQIVYQVELIELIFKSRFSNLKNQ